MKNLIEFNGLWFYEGTTKEVMNVVSNNQGRYRRFRFWYGDKETGKSWNEENDVCGYVGRSTGTKKIPLLINNCNSYGGGALMTDSIIKIVDTRTKRVLYQHESFNQPEFIVRSYDCAVLAENDLHAQGFKNEKQAQRYADFVNGKRMSK